MDRKACNVFKITEMGNGMKNTLYCLDGYQFLTKREFERAHKEKETISYLKETIRSGKPKELLKVYNRSVEKHAFCTVIGLQFLQEIRTEILQSGIVGEDTLAPIPVAVSEQAASDKQRKGSGATDSGVTGKTEIERQLKRYKKAYEEAVTGKTIKNMVITVLLIIILGMLLVTFKTRYSVFTYFTNYKEEMREELVDEYEQWQDQLEQKEKQLDERENALKNK